jgi:DNA topoisomerase-3
LRGEGFAKPNKGVDQGDHPPITPVLSASKNELGDREWKLYSFITRTFMGSISEDAVYDEVRVIF